MKTYPLHLSAHHLGRLFCLILLMGCATAQGRQELITVQIAADGRTFTVQLAPGRSVQEALEATQLKLGPLDRSEPAPYSVLVDGARVRLVRVTEQFEVEQEVIPFERKLLRNESLSRETEILLQGGKNGLQEITYRRVFEDGKEVSGEPIPIRVSVVEQPFPEIRMTGVQTPFLPVPIPGRLVYLRDGSAWLIEGATGNRRAIVTSGDLDGYVFSLSNDGSRLLFTRKSNEDGQINSLWVAQVGEPADVVVDLGVRNVIYFADWLPQSNTQVLFSTVKPQVAEPGWSANNDLNLLTIFKSQQTKQTEVQLTGNLGGVYPWWGVSYSWAASGLQLAYANDHSVGVMEVSVVDTELNEEQFSTRLEFPPLQTYASWAWVPGISWGPDGRTIYTLDHFAPAEMALPEESQLFDLTAIPMEGGDPIRLVTQVGMFAYPQASPLQTLPSGETAYQIAYLQAVFPTQSETSRYRLMIIDRDGSNRREVFPAEGAPGIVPQREWGAWSPAPMPGSENWALAILYQGNLWLVDATTGQSQQITADGLTSRVVWKNPGS